MDKLYDEASEAINKLFGNTSVPRSETKRRLSDLAGEIEAKELDADAD
jgi:hypothetical protein